MNDVWRRIFRKYVDSFNAIKTLERNNVIDGEDVTELEHFLLEDVIGTMKSEIEEKIVNGECNHVWLLIGQDEYSNHYMCDKCHVYKAESRK